MSDSLRTFRFPSPFAAISRRACVAVACCASAIGTAAAGQNPPLTTAELLVDLARDYALDRRGNQTDADVQHVEALLLSAARLSPKLPDPYVWLYELAALRGDQPAAARFLEQLVNADPANEGAFARWLDIGPTGLQTVESRADWHAKLLERDWPPPLRGLIHLHLASLSLERLDRVAARKHVDEAARLIPNSPELGQIELALSDERDSLAQRLAALVRALRLDPLSVDIAWSIGELLDKAGLPEEASRFYAAAMKTLEATGEAQSIDVDALLQLSRNALARGKQQDALDYAHRAVSLNLQPTRAAIYLWWLLQRSEKSQEADAIRTQLAARFAQIKDPQVWPVDEIAQAAWFYCTADPQPQRALVLAEAAHARAPSDLFVQRALGWAQAANLQNDLAERTLAPLAGQDPYAAYQLARIFTDLQQPDRAAAILAKLEHAPRAGPAADLLAQLPGYSATTQAAPAGDMLAQLATLETALPATSPDPTRSVELTVELDDLSPGPGEPWWAAFTLRNVGERPISLGARGNINPVLLISFSMQGDQRREFPNLFTVDLDRRLALAPGESVSVRRTLDVGPVRDVSRRTAQQLQRVAITVLLDPQQIGEKWVSGAPGVTIRPVYFNRMPAGVTREDLNALLSALRSDDSRQRFRAVEVLAELLAEHQRQKLGRLSYRPEPVPAEPIYQALLASLNSDSWELRARTLDALQVAGLDAKLLAAAQGCLSHANPLVRMMALRLLARQGPAFADSTRRLAQNDPDDLVRKLAGSYLLRWQAETPAPPAASQPASDTAPIE